MAILSIFECEEFLSNRGKQKQITENQFSDTSLTTSSAIREMKDEMASTQIPSYERDAFRSFVEAVKENPLWRGALSARSTAG